MALTDSTPWTTGTQGRGLLERWFGAASQGGDGGAYDTDRFGALGNLYRQSMGPAMMPGHPGFDPRTGYSQMPSWGGAMMPMMMANAQGGGYGQGRGPQSSYLNPQMYIPGTPLNLWAMAHDPNNPMRNHPGFRVGNRIVGAGGTPTSWGNAGGLYSTAANRGARRMPNVPQMEMSYWARRKMIEDWSRQNPWMDFDLNEDVVEDMQGGAEPDAAGEGGGAGMPIVTGESAGQSLYDRTVTGKAANRAAEAAAAKKKAAGQGGGGGLVQPTATGGGIYQDYKAKLNKPVK